MLQIWEHEYRPNWAVTDAGYEVLVGKPWHVDHNLMIDHKTGNVPLHNEKLSILQNYENENVISQILASNAFDHCAKNLIPNTAIKLTGL